MFHDAMINAGIVGETVVTDLMWTFAALVAVILCAIRALLDLRERRYLWAATSVAIAAVILLAPTRPISVTIPIADRR